MLILNKEDQKKMKFLIDEDISPSCARYLCEELLIDAVAVRDRGLLGKNDRYILEYAFNDDHAKHGAARSHFGYSEYC